MAGAVLLLAATLVAGCRAIDPADADDAQELVLRHLAERVEDGPWQVICLRREPAAGQESEDSFLRRFEGQQPPMVPASLCAPAGEDGFEWVVEETGAMAVEIILGTARRNLDGSLVVPAGTSTGTVDRTDYGCTVVQRDDTWQLDECVVTATT